MELPSPNAPLAETAAHEALSATASGVDQRLKPSLGVVFEMEETPLLRYAYGLSRRREVAEDLVQEAFLRLHQHWDQVLNPRAWLYRCVRNLALNHLRDHKREVMGDQVAEPIDGSRPDEDLGRLEAVGMVRMLMAEMPDEDRSLLVLKYQEHLSYNEISKRSGLSIGNVGYRLHHLLKNLGDSLRQAGVEGSQG